MQDSIVEDLIAQTQAPAAAPGPEKFHVRSRSAALRVARMIWGPTARTWTRRSRSSGELADLVVAGLPDAQGRPSAGVIGVDFSDSLRGPTEVWLEESKDFAEYKARWRQLFHAGALPGDVAGKAMDKFKAEIAAEVEAELARREAASKAVVERAQAQEEPAPEAEKAPEEAPKKRSVSLEALVKALEAGGYNAAPEELVQGTSFSFD